MPNNRKNYFSLSLPEMSRAEFEVLNQHRPMCDKFEHTQPTQISNFRELRDVLNNSTMIVCLIFLLTNMATHIWKLKELKNRVYAKKKHSLRMIKRSFEFARKSCKTVDSDSSK